jgi:hypothetical protein
MGVLTTPKSAYKCLPASNTTTTIIIIHNKHLSNLHEHCFIKSLLPSAIAFTTEQNSKKQVKPHMWLRQWTIPTPRAQPMAVWL